MQILLVLALVSIGFAEEPRKTEPKADGLIVDVTKTGEPKPEKSITDASVPNPSTLNSSDLKPEKIAEAVESEPKPKKSLLRAHEAEYKIDLLKNTNEEILDVYGTLKIRLLESNGWAMEEHSTLTVVYVDGTVEEYETSLASWESMHHNEYHFTSTSSNSGEEGSDRVVIRGKSKITPTESLVQYESPEVRTVDVPRDVVFPINLTEILLQDGADFKGQKKLSRKVNLFDGSNELCKTIHVNAVLVPKKPKLKINGTADLNFENAYLLQMAAHDSGGMEPTYLTSRTIQENGIILSLEMDFPEIGFTTKAQLTKVNVYTASDKNIVSVAQQDRAQDS